MSLLVTAGLSLYYIYQTLSNMGEGSNKSETRKKAKTTLRRLQANNPELQTLELNEYEKIILASVITPSEIKIGFKGMC